MAGKIRTYRDLDIWNAGIQIVKDVYEISENFPKHELYGLTSQMRRAGISNEKESFLLEKTDHISRMIMNLIKKLT